MYAFKKEKTNCDIALRNDKYFMFELGLYWFVFIANNGFKSTTKLKYRKSY